MKLTVPCTCHLAIHYEWKQSYVPIKCVYLTSPLSAIFSSKSHIQWAAAKIITLAQWFPNLFRVRRPPGSHTVLCTTQRKLYFFLPFYNNSPKTGFLYLYIYFILKTMKTPAHFVPWEIIIRESVLGICLLSFEIRIITVAKICHFPN
jgi:hypothetical protein